MRRYTITPGGGIDSLTLVDCPTPEPGPGQLLVALKAASLNYRDLLIADGMYPGGGAGGIVPLSDGAGEVVAIGEGCSRFKVGDRVAGIFMQSWARGEIVDADLASALGGAVDGMLAEYRLFDERGLVAIPETLSFAEAATLPCAAVTAWNALFEMKPIVAGQTVLTLGTGGVSMFALQFAHAAGARVIATSSSDDKLERARALGAAETINYRTTEGWASEVRRLTGGRGVDMVIEVGGPGTLGQSIAATARGGSVQMIGVLSFAQIDPLPILTGGVIVRGLMVGSGEMFERMNRAIVANHIRPIIDRRFDFGDAAAAYHHLRSGSHFGKVVIDIAD